MIKNNPNDIEEIPYPEEFRDTLKGITPLLIASMERDGLPIESGKITIKMEEKMRLPLFFFDWISDFNEVIDNLNIILSDLRNLPKQYPLLSGSPRIRFYLLVRTYFYEFYRFKEIFNRSIKEFQNGGYIEKTETINLREAFYKTFEHTIEIRNTFVHGKPLWKGKRHFDLNIVGGAFELGYEIRDPKTGNIRDVAMVLQDSCDHMAAILKDEGTKISRSLQETTKYFVEAASSVQKDRQKL